MREIATEARLAPGAAYYYFPSKESMVFGFYEKTYEDHLPIVDKVLATRKKLGDRLNGVVAAHIRVAQKFKNISRTLFKTAADPEHEISPFSRAARPLRNKNIQIMKNVIEGATENIHRDLVNYLPQLLWLYKMGIILYWLHDRSKNDRKTFLLIDKSTDLIAKLISIAGLPGLRSITLRTFSLIDDFNPY